MSNILFFKVLVFIVVFTSWIPIQQLTYLTPYLLLFLAGIHYALSNPKKNEGKPLLFVLIVISVFMGLVLYGLLIGSTLYAPALWLFTHGYIFFLLSLMLLMKGVGREIKLIHFFVKVNLWFGVVEAVIGSGQFFMGPSFADTAAAGDYVIGTLGNNSHLFAMKMLFVSILASYMYVVTKKKVYFLFILLFLQAWLLGSALHTILVMGMALALYTLLMSSNIKKLLRTLLVTTSLALLLFVSLWSVQENNIRYFIAKLSFVNIASPTLLLFGKVELFKRTVIQIPEKEGVDVMLLGFGPGAYSSRASWMLSGHYLGHQSVVPVAPSHAWQVYLSDLWDTDVLKRYKWMQGVANQPFSTWMSILGEFGWLGLSFVFWLSYRLLKKLRRLAKKDYAAMAGLLVTAFVLSSFFFDNWDEYPRFFLPCVLFVFLVIRVNKYNLAPVHFKNPVRGRL